VTRKLCILVALFFFFAPSLTFSKKKEKPLLPEVLLKAQTVVVIIQPGTGEPTNDPNANSKAREAVEKALMNWGRFRLVQETYDADIVITVKKGFDKPVTPEISGGPVDRRPVTVQSTDTQIRIGAKQGTPTDGSYDPDLGSSNGNAHPSMEAGPPEDAFLVYLGGQNYTPNNAAVWSFRAKNALRPPDVAAVQAFHQAITDTEQAAAQKQKKQPPPQQTNP
jgi:hypothetical protein